MKTLPTSLENRSGRALCIAAGLFFLFTGAFNLSASAGKNGQPAETALTGWNICWEGKETRMFNDGGTETIMALACKPNVNVSLGQEGYAALTALLLVNAPAYPANLYLVDIMGPLHDTVYCAQLGQSLMVLVTEIPTGNSCMSTIFVEDKLKPVLECTSDTLPCTVNIPQIDFDNFIETIEDNCDDDPDLFYAYTVQNLPCNANGFTQSILVTWTATDQSGNSTTCQDIIYLKKPSLGQIVFPSDVTVSCINPNINPSVTGEPTYNGVPIGLTCQLVVTHTDQVVPMCNGSQKILRLWTVMDWCTSGTVTDVQEIRIIDNVPPVLTCPGNLTVNTNIDVCTYKYTLPMPGVTDACSNPNMIDIDIFVSTVPGIFVPGNMVTLGLGTTLVTIRATDPCNNSSMCQYSVTVRDNTPPLMICPGNVTIDCTESTDPTNTGTATASDNCDPAPLVTYSDVTVAVMNCMSGLRVTRTWRATDNNGNTNLCMQMILLTDNAPPVISCPGNITVQCANQVPAANPASVTASDNCSGMATVVFVGDVIGNQTCANRFTVTRTYRAIDGCGNSSTCQQTISVFDNTAPSVLCPANITVQCTNQVPVPNTASVSSTDNCSGTATVTFVNDVISNQTCSNRYTITRTYRATDACGNSAICNQLINVFDNTAPSISCPTNITVQCASQVPVSNPSSVGATDNCGGTATVTFVADVITNQTCANRFTVTRTYRATDACGNSTTCNQIITVLDNTAPSISCPANVTVQCASLVPASNPSAVGTTDNCGGTATVTFVGDVISNQTCANRFTVTRTYRSSDACGNSATCTQIITVFDNIAPSLTCPANVTVQCASQVPAPVDPSSLSAADNCGGTSTVIFLGEVISNQTCLNKFTLSRTYRASDACGNSTTCVQTIVVNDNIAPVITCPSNVTVQCTDSTAPGNTGSATATDNCAAIPTITFSDVTIGSACPQERTITRTWSATDGCGNTSTCNQTIVVDDATAPLCVAQNITVSLNGNGMITILPSQVGGGSTDNCGPVNLALSPQDFNCNNLGNNLVVLTVTDCALNSSTCTAIVTINDGGGLQASCKNIIILLDVNGNVTIDPEDVDNGSGGGCGGGTLDFDLTQTNFNCTNLGQNIVTLTVTDGIGNSATCTAVVTVQDNIPPMITCPANMTVDCHVLTNPDNTGQFGTATGTDNCPGVTISETHVINLNNCNVGTITRTHKATDGSNNMVTCIQTISVVNPNPLDVGDITWPASPVSVNICNSTEPGSIPNGIPVINPSALLCGTPVVAHTDVVQTFVDNNPNTPCKVITRTWTVTDNCHQPPATFMFVQTINVQDMVPPLFTNINDMTKVANANCVANFNLIASATDCAGVTITNNSPFGVNSGSNASGNYPVGVTVVLFTATDGCGNISTMDVVITVTDANPADFQCEKTIVFLPEELQITLSGRIFVTFLDGSCSDPDDFLVSFSRTDPYDTTNVYDCGDVGVHTFPLWFFLDGVTPLVIDSCFTADLDLRDPDDFCQDGLVLPGGVESEDGKAVAGVEVSITNVPMTPDTTDDYGRYVLEGLNKGTGYLVAPFNDLNHREGVSTLDLVLIQKHLLGRALLNSPYKIIAADANRSGSLTALDLLEIRKLILGINSRFANNTSWRFIDRAYVFPDPYNPFIQPFSESVWLDSVTQEINSIDFVGVKIGDVNGSYFLTRASGDRIEPRNSSDLELDLHVYASKQSAGNKIEVSVPDRQGQIDGLQFSLFVGDLSSEQVKEIRSDILSSSEWYYDPVAGAINVSWSTANPVELSGKLILNLPAISKSSMNFEITRTAMPAEAYVVDGDQIEIRNIRLRMYDVQDAVLNEYHLYQNIPNPFVDGTVISFNLPQPEKVRLVIYDNTGKQVFDYSMMGGAGHNDIPVKAGSLKYPGIYYYTLYTANASFTRKMSFTNN